MFIVVFLSIKNVTSIAQRPVLDSLYSAASVDLTPDSLYATLQKGILAAMKVDARQGKKFSTRMLAMDYVTRDSSRLMLVKKQQAICERVMGNYVKSIKEHKECYNYFKRTSDTIKWAQCADQLGSMMTFTGNVKGAQGYLLEVYDLYTSAGTTRNIASACNGLAILYDDMQQPEKALVWYEKAMSKYTECNDSTGLSSVNANLGLLYTGLKNYEKAEYHLREQGVIDSLLGDTYGLGFYHDFMGYLRTRQGRYQEALAELKKSLNYRSKLESHYNIAETRGSLAETYIALHRYDDAIREANLILEKKQAHKSLSQELLANELLSRAYEKKGNLSLALKYYKDYTTVNDSLYNRDLLEEITEKDALFEKAQNEAKIALLHSEKKAAERLLQQKNRTIMIGSGALLLISLLMLFLYLTYAKVRKQRELIKKALGEKDILLREIHHRVKNNLQLVSSLLTLQGQSIEDATALEAIKEGKTRVRSMALIHKNLYSRENLTGIGVKEYVENLCVELFATYRVDKGRIRLEQSIENLEIDVDTLVPMGLILNELITNALKYAFPNGKNGRLQIFLHEHDGVLELRVKDDGVGYDPSNVRDNSFGATLINALTEQLEGTLDTKTSSQGTLNVLRIQKYNTV